MNYSFPKLKYQEIIVCLKDQGIPITLADLKTPTEQTVRPIFEKLVETVMDLSKDEMRQPHFRAIDALQQPELHEESLGEVLMCKAILDMIKAAGFHNVGLRDIYTPNAKTTKMILSALINFSKFRYERSATFQEYTNQTDEILQLGLQMEEENSELQAQLRDLRIADEKNQPIIQSLEQETAALAHEISEMNVQHTQLSKETRELKAATSEANDVIASDKLRLLQAQQEVARLRQQVVRSPEKIRQMLRSMTNAVESDKEEVAHTNARFRAMTTKHTAIKKLHNKILKRTATMQECQSQMALNKKQNTELREAKQATAHYRHLTEQLVTEEKHLTEQITSAQRKLSNLANQYQKQKGAAQTALDKVVDEKRYLEEGIDKENAQVSHNVTLLNSRRKQLETMQRSHEEERAQLLEKYQQLSTSLSSYHETLLQHMR